MIDVWTLEFEDHVPDDEGRREALCCLGNGYLSTRGAVAEGEADELHYPGTYLAGCYDRLTSEVGGRLVDNEDLVNLPDWRRIRFRMPDGRSFTPQRFELLEYRQVLDMRRGTLERIIRFEDGHGRRTRFVTRRFIHMRHAHLAVQEATWTAENWTGTIEVQVGLDGRVVNAGVQRYRGLADQHLDHFGGHAPDDETVVLQVQTRQSQVRVAQALRSRVFRAGILVSVPREVVIAEDRAHHRLHLSLDEGVPLTVECVQAMHSSRDAACTHPEESAIAAAARAPDAPVLLAEHQQEWEHLWDRYDVRIANPEPYQKALIQQAIRLHLFHLIQTASRNTMDLDVGLPARGWTGEAYRGHVFWDEVYIFPTITMHMPEVTRGLLKYRFRRLDAARSAALDAGFKGAMFPWQSGSEGYEETQQMHLNPRSGHWLPDHSHLQRHVNVAIAYNVWQYHHITNDAEFLSSYGAELFLEIARFMASLCTKGRDGYEIRGVMGPDEYHDGYPGREQPGIDNNAYTNLMAAWVLWRAEDVLASLPEVRRRELLERLGITDEERRSWDERSKSLVVPMHDGIISQFEGYDALEEFDWEAYRRRYGNIQRLDRILEAEDDTPNRYKASKQADVLMLFYLFDDDEIKPLLTRLGVPWDDGLRTRMVDYYLARSSHGSTLSHSVHSWVMADTAPKESWRLFLTALQSDLEDIQGGTTKEGIHLGAMSSTVDLLQRRYAGISVRDGVLHIDPRMPEQLTHLAMRLHFRGRDLDLEMDAQSLRIRCLGGPAGPLPVRLAGHDALLQAGQELEWAWDTVHARQS